MQLLVWWLVHLAVCAALVFGGEARATVVATPDCSNGQHWYGNAEVYGYWSSAEQFYADLFTSYGGDEAAFLAYWQGTKVVTPGGTRIVNGAYGSFPYSPVDVCTVGDAPVSAGSGGTVTLVLPEVTQDHVDAVNAIFAATLAALCAVAGVAWLVRFFNRSPDA